MSEVANSSNNFLTDTNLQDFPQTSEHFGAPAKKLTKPQPGSVLDRNVDSGGESSSMDTTVETGVSIENKSLARKKSKYEELITSPDKGQSKSSRNLALSSSATVDLNEDNKNTKRAALTRYQRHLSELKGGSCSSFSLSPRPVKNERAFTFNEQAEQPHDGGDAPHHQKNDYHHQHKHHAATYSHHHNSDDQDGRQHHHHHDRQHHHHHDRYHSDSHHQTQSIREEFPGMMLAPASASASHSCDPHDSHISGAPMPMHSHEIPMPASQRPSVPTINNTLPANVNQTTNGMFNNPASTLLLTAALTALSQVNNGQQDMNNPLTSAITAASAQILAAALSQQTMGLAAGQGAAYPNPQSMVLAATGQQPSSYEAGQQSVLTGVPPLYPSPAGTSTQPHHDAHERHAHHQHNHHHSNNNQHEHHHCDVVASHGHEAHHGAMMHRSNGINLSHPPSRLPTPRQEDTTVERAIASAFVPAPGSSQPNSARDRLQSLSFSDDSARIVASGDHQGGDVHSDSGESSESSDSEASAPHPSYRDYLARYSSGLEAVGALRSTGGPPKGSVEAHGGLGQLTSRSHSESPPNSAMMISQPTTPSNGDNIGNMSKSRAMMDVLLEGTDSKARRLQAEANYQKTTRHYSKLFHSCDPKVFEASFEVRDEEKEPVSTIGGLLKSIKSPYRASMANTVLSSPRFVKVHEVKLGPESDSVVHTLDNNLDNSGKDSNESMYGFGDNSSLCDDSDVTPIPLKDGIASKSELFETSSDMPPRETTQKFRSNISALTVESEDDMNNTTMSVKGGSVRTLTPRRVQLSRKEVSLSRGNSYTNDIVMGGGSASTRNVHRSFVYERSMKNMIVGYQTNSIRGQAKLHASALDFIQEQSLNSAFAKNLKLTSLKNKNVLVGWQVLILRKAELTMLGLAVITGVRTNMFFQTEYRISSDVSLDCWMRLKCDTNQTGTEFQPLRKVLHTRQVYGKLKIIPPPTESTGADSIISTKSFTLGNSKKNQKSTSQLRLQRLQSKHSSQEFGDEIESYPFPTM